MTAARLDPYSETIVPRAAVSFPLPVPAPEGFDPDRLETWPHVTGRLEWVEGTLWYMPPTGDDQQDTTADVVTELNLWRRAHPEFVVGTNEAGMKLSGDVRAADAAVWRRTDLPPENTGGPRRTPASTTPSTRFARRRVGTSRTASSSFGCSSREHGPRS